MNQLRFSTESDIHFIDPLLGKRLRLLLLLEIGAASTARCLPCSPGGSLWHVSVIMKVPAKQYAAEIQFTSSALRPLVQHERH